MGLQLCQNFVSAQYLENKLTEFHIILYTKFDPPCDNVSLEDLLCHEI